jgi:hypothetical protein
MEEYRTPSARQIEFVESLTDGQVDAIVTLCADATRTNGALSPTGIRNLIERGRIRADHLASEAVPAGQKKESPDVGA